jgi:hypothetical protein
MLVGYYACVIQRQSFGGGSVMVRRGITAHGRTPLIVVAGNLTGMRYRDEIVQQITSTPR